MATPGQIGLLAVTEYRVERMLHGTCIAVIHKLGHSLVCNGLSVVGETDQHLPRFEPTVLASMAITKILDHLLTSPYSPTPTSRPVLFPTVATAVLAHRVVGFEGVVHRGRDSASYRGHPVRVSVECHVYGRVPGHVLDESLPSKSGLNCRLTLHGRGCQQRCLVALEASRTSRFLPDHPIWWRAWRCASTR